MAPATSGRGTALLILLSIAAVAALPLPVAASHPAQMTTDLCNAPGLTERGRITTTLTLPAGEYVADCTVSVEEGVALTLQSGTTIGFSERGSLTVRGRLDVQGSAPGDVVLTSDDAVKAAGQWRGIRVEDDASATIRGTTIEYGGRNGAFMVEADGPITMTNSAITDGEGGGVELTRVPGSITDTSIERHARIGISITEARDGVITVTLRGNTINEVVEAAVEADPSVQLDHTDNRASDNGINGIRIGSGAIDGPLTWRGGDLPYVLSSRIQVRAPLTVEPATIVKFEDGDGLRVMEGGRLSAIASESDPVFFTTITDDDACLFSGETDERISCDTGNDGDKARIPGAWDNIEFEAESDGGTFEHAVIRYGENGQVETGVAGLTMTDVTVEFAESNGIIVNNRSGAASSDFLTLRDSVLRENGGAAVSIETDAPITATIEGNRFSNNAVAVSAVADVELLVARNESSGSGINGFQISGDQSTARTWRAGDLPFIPANEISLTSAGAVLTIEPGTVVKSLEDGGIEVDRGQLVAGSLEGDPVLFTTVDDDACSAAVDAGCDTNGDGDASEPDPGDWRRITVERQSQGATLHNVEIRYGGTRSTNAALVEISRPSEVRQSVLHHGTGPGILIDETQATIVDNVIHTNGLSGRGGAGIQVLTGSSELSIGFSGNQIYNNNGGAIEIAANVELELDGTNSTEEPAGFQADPPQVQLNGIVVEGQVTQNLTWRRGQLPFVIRARVIVEGQATLTIDPGVLVKFEDRGSLEVGSGVLEASGTEGNPIIFTSVADTEGGVTKRDSGDPAPGDWPGLRFNLPGAAGKQARVEHVEIRYAGADGEAAIYVEQPDVMVTNTVIRNGGADGIRIADAPGIVLSNNAITDMRDDGIVITTEQGLEAQITDNVIERCAAAITIDGDVQPVISGNAVSGNRINGIRVRNDITKLRTWPAGNLVYVLDDVVRIRGGRLTVEPGAVIKGDVGARLFVDDGTLRLTADPEEPRITLTSIRDDDCGALAEEAEQDSCDTDGRDLPPLPGDWQGIQLGDGADEAHLQNISLRYAGNGGQALEVQIPSNFYLRDSEVVWFQGNGLVIEDTTGAEIENNSFRDGRGAGIVVDNDASARISANIFTGNQRPIIVESSEDVETANNVAVGNENDALLFDASVTTSQTWTGDLVRDIEGSVTVSNNADLVISPGSMLRFAEDGSIRVTSNRLEAQGVIFTADRQRPGAGYWDHVTFDDQSSGSLRHSTLAFGGSSSRGAVHVESNAQGEQIRVEYNTFLRSEGTAISTDGDGVDPDIIGNLIREVLGNNAFGIKISDDGGRDMEVRNNFISGAENGIQVVRKLPQITLNHLADIRGLALENRTSDQCVFAENNWWGDAAGPLDTDDSEDERDPRCQLHNPGSTGAEVSESVNYQPRLTSALPGVPMLDLPRAGVTSNSELVVAGTAGANADVVIFDGDDELARARAASDGSFVTEIDVSPGTYEISVESEATIQFQDSAAGAQPQDITVSSPRTGYRLVQVVPDQVVDPASIAFIFGRTGDPIVQPLREVTGAAPACGGPSGGRVTIPENTEVQVRLAPSATVPSSLQYVQGDTQIAFSELPNGLWQTEPFQPAQGSFQIVADGDAESACDGFVYIGGAGRVFSDTGSPGEPKLTSSFETSNDGWIPDRPWTRIDSDASDGTVSFKTGEPRGILRAAAFEGGNDGWTPGGSWARTTQDAFSGSWSMTDSPEGEHAPSGSGALTISTGLDLSSVVAPEIVFIHKHDFGRGDRGRVEVRAQGGPWIEIEDFSGSERDWTRERVSLEDVAGQAGVQIRFNLTGNGDDNVGEGWWIDDIVIRPGGDYAPDTEAALTIAEPIDLRDVPSPEITFDQKYDFGRSDSGKVEVRVGDEGRWEEVQRFDGVRNGWHGARVPLDAYAREPRVHIRFLLDASGDDEVGAGWTVDNISIEPGGANNGRFDVGEPLVEGATVRLERRDPTSGRFTTYQAPSVPGVNPLAQTNPQRTDAAGRYAFYGLPTGEYRLQIDPPAGSGLSPYVSVPPLIVVDGTLDIDVPMATSRPIYLPMTQKQYETPRR